MCVHIYECTYMFIYIRTCLFINIITFSLTYVRACFLYVGRPTSGYMFMYIGLYAYVLKALYITS